MKKLILLALGLGVISSLSAEMKLTIGDKTIRGGEVRAVVNGIKPDAKFESPKFWIKDPGAKGFYIYSPDASKAKFGLRGPVNKVGLSGEGQFVGDLKVGEYTIVNPETTLGKEFTIVVESAV